MTQRSLPGALWHELTRPRTLTRTRTHRRDEGGRRVLRRGRRAGGRRSGIALLVAITTLLVLSVVVSELAYISRVRFLVAYHQRDRAQAYWLARSGVNIYTLVLVADKQIGNQIQQFAGDIGFNSLWQMIPVLNTGLMRMLFASGGVGDAGIDDLDDEQLEQFSQTGQVSDEVAAASREGGSVFDDRNFLDFEGDFSAEVTDNESKVDVNQFAGESGPIQDSPVGQYLFALMSSEENDMWLRDRNLDRWEIIGNLRDWVDTDNVRSGGLGGYEDNLYNSQDPPYLAKNAKFDSIDEIRLVEGWQDDVFDKFGGYLTIYANGKSNPNNWDDIQHAAAIAQGTGLPFESVITLPCLAEQTDNQIIGFSLVGMTFKNKRDYVNQVNGLCGVEMEANNLTLNFTGKSRVFTVKSTGLVGTSSVTITAVLDFNSTNVGQLRYWRIE